MRRMRRWIWIIPMLTLLCPNVLARADEADARKLFDEGEADFAAARFVDAAHAFERAFAESHATKLLWNIAQSWRRQYAISGDRADLLRARSVLQNYEQLCEGNDRIEAAKALSEVDEAVRTAEAKRKPPPPAPNTARTLKVSGMAVAGTGLALTGMGITFAVLARSAFNEINTPVPGYVFSPATQENMHTYEALGDVFLATGLVAVATGASLFAVGARKARFVRLFPLQTAPALVAEF
jgi:hypothetical protein